MGNVPPQPTEQQSTAQPERPSQDAAPAKQKWWRNSENLKWAIGIVAALAIAVVSSWLAGVFSRQPPPPPPDPQPQLTAVHPNPVLESETLNVVGTRLDLVEYVKLQWAFESFFLAFYHTSDTLLAVPLDSRVEAGPYMLGVEPPGGKTIAIVVEPAVSPVLPPKSP